MINGTDGRRALKRVALPVVDLALTLRPVREWALKRGDRMLYDFYCVRRFEGLPLGVQEFRHRAIMNLLSSIERAVADGRIGRRARLGVLRSLVGEAVVNARKNVAPFIERYGYEPPGFVVISPTQRCNLHCHGCYSSSSNRAAATLSYDVLTKVVADVRDNWGSHLVVVSGGEPLLYRSQGKDLFDLFRAFPDVYFMMYSNGTLLDERTVTRLEQAGNVSPAISVEGFEPETDARRGPGVYRKIELAMQLLRRHGVPFGISMTATRENADTLLSEDIIAHYFDRRGAVYAWMFHYMPIGRSYSIDLMPTPEQRKRMLERQLELLRERRLFFIDFWNGGPMSGGCISAGRSGGYFHIDWNGDVSPCVFIPYAVDNVYRIYEEQRTLSSALGHPVLAELRQWQKEYSGRDGHGYTHNLFRPCPIRDHHEMCRNILLRHGARPIHEDAARALADPEYAARMIEFGHQLAELLDPFWEREVVAREPTAFGVVASRERPAEKNGQPSASAGSVTESC